MFCVLKYNHYLCSVNQMSGMKANEKMAYDRLTACGLKPSVQRLAIMEYLLTHNTHPTVEDVFKALGKKIPTLSKTTVYNTLRLFSENSAAQMLTIDERRVCYDGIIEPHVHFFCRKCGKIYDVRSVEAPRPVSAGMVVDGNVVDEVQLYYKGLCADCAAGQDKKDK